ncbi:MAG: polysaccharide biosynthesis/export family protein, partial [Planctomycetes bacterium]|nr:polysaccharide biosynthesis/export family protein [Planctomycetota bacterium]
MTALKAALYGLTLSLLIVFCVGCADDILDPTQTGRFRPVPALNVILESLGVADEPDPAYAGAESPGPDDLIDYERDYVFGAGDVIRISIYELRQEGRPFINDYVVTESGRVSIPDVGLVRAAGLTEVKLEEEIKAILSPGILKDPSVTVLLLQSQSRLFSIYGQGVGQSGRFSIPRYTFRLTGAIALAGDVGQFNVTYIYISRDVPVT